MLEKIAIKTINEYNLIDEFDKIIIGVSGGADSISLLYFLNSIKKQFNLKIFATHINHCLRGDEADEDTLFVKSFCEKLNIPLEIFYYDIKKEAKNLNMSLEEAGRYFRYKAFNETLKKYNANKIAVAHNKNDNVETFFMRLFRGSGIKGLSGIPYKRENIIRPLLNCERYLIEKYCEKNNLKFKNDSTNFKDIYTRNKIRLNLIPSIQNDFNENLIDTISNTISSFNEENIFLENMASTLFNECLKEKNKNSVSINLSLFKTYSVVMQKRILRLSLCNFSKNLYNISFEHINLILNLLSKQSGKMINLPNNIKVKITHNILYFFLEENTISFSYTLKEDCVVFIKELNKYAILSKKLNNNGIFSTKVYTISFNCDTIKEYPVLRSKKPGDIIFINGMHKKLKKIFIDLKIPYYERNLIPVLAEKNNIIALPYLFISDDYKISNEKENTIYLHLWED